MMRLFGSSSAFAMSLCRISFMVRATRFGFLSLAAKISLVPSLPGGKRRLPSTEIISSSSGMLLAGFSFLNSIWIFSLSGTCAMFNTQSFSAEATSGSRSSFSPSGPKSADLEISTIILNFSMGIGAKIISHFEV
eukprot:Skav217337  [mRNA]  locus=scaffold1410:135906:138366:+ [translate_table: standard]